MILPITLKHGIDIEGASWFIRIMSFLISYGSKKSSILSFAPSARYERAQQISIIISS